MRRVLAVCVANVLVLGAAAAAPALDRDAVNGARFEAGAHRKPAGKRPDPVLIKAQVLLDRARFSPGAIDGRDGDNLRGALKAFAEAKGMPASGHLDGRLWEALAGSSQDPVLTDYALTKADAEGPYAEEIPAKMEDQAELKALSYTGPAEMLAERFHMSRALFDALNPDKDLGRAGTVVTVAAVPPLATDRPGKGLPEEPKVARIVVGKEALQVRAYGGDGALLAVYPASVGSEEKPAPEGRFKVEGVTLNPTYTYDPKYAFKGVEATRKFTIKPGPNNPVGLVWIELSAESYGIHGTPEPEKIGKSESHGCIRLTNWDARDLALHVARGATVEIGE
ncbi:ErfK/YbiS/YcfS/YnhG family protein [Methylobacterium sp. 4-46]|uniref:L,D-transpeptidase family protein n=1 Tax=unclassified Methylobacterium TaxID=2615210 RepID=UPI000152E27E|nr:MULTISPECIES: L,D-transpeptidase [Methylobacterium]ACA14601.1 ErfK/YbiS/YcfS/YnhG family protein [Methylobacterium sp. 4-46]WFT80357.1 L,D-transpeptidase [Methylobacterium nodulans]